MTHPGPEDVHGGATLDTLAAADRYNAWQVDLLRPHIGRRVIEIGSGIGNISAQLLRLDLDRLLLTDMDEAYRQTLRTRFGADPRVTVDQLHLPAPDARVRFAEERFDTAIALNVVEHIEDDLGAVRTMRDALVPGGRVVVLVPAMQAIYGKMDEALGHFRRYTRASLVDLFRRADLTVEHSTWFNRAGVPGWWWHGKVRGRADVPAGGVRLFDSLVPLFRLERFLPLPFGQSVIAIGRTPAA
jgi:SAM-dependent methyltransferase